MTSDIIVVRKDFGRYMNYEKIYNDLIKKKRVKITKYEKHHIVPRCCGGSDALDNIVKLLPREHFIAHLLLTKIHPKNSKLRYALLCMNLFSKNKGFSSLNYEKYRLEFYKNQKIRMTKNNPMKGRKGAAHPRWGVKHSSATKKRISENTKALFKDPEYRRKHGIGVSKGVTGEKHPMYGKNHSQKAKDRIAASKGITEFVVKKEAKIVGKWSNLTTCAKALNLSISKISLCLHKKRSMHKGYSFEFL